MIILTSLIFRTKRTEDEIREGSPGLRVDDPERRTVAERVRFDRRRLPLCRSRPDDEGPVESAECRKHLPVNRNAIVSVLNCEEETDDHDLPRNTKAVREFRCTTPELGS